VREVRLEPPHNDLGRVTLYAEVKNGTHALMPWEEYERLQRVVDAARKVTKSSRKDINLGPPLSLWGLHKALRELEDADE
jgi:hypothetical protein